MIRKFLFVLILPLGFLGDRLSKGAVVVAFQEGEGMAVIPGVFHLVRVNNPGAAFGLLKDSGIWLILISLLSSLWFLAYLWRAFGQAPLKAAPSSFWKPEAVALVAAGALGNLYDRLVYGYVVDFLDFRVWPVFNLADVCIVLGVFWIVWGLRCTRF